MTGPKSHVCGSLLAFSMPMIAFLIALGIGLIVSSEEVSEEKEKQTAEPQNTPQEP